MLSLVEVSYASLWTWPLKWEECHSWLVYEQLYWTRLWSWCAVWIHLRRKLVKFLQFDIHSLHSNLYILRSFFDVTEWLRRKEIMMFAAMIARNHFKATYNVHSNWKLAGPLQRLTHVENMVTLHTQSKCNWSITFQKDFLLVARNSLNFYPCRACCCTWGPPE